MSNGSPLRMLALSVNFQVLKYSSVALKWYELTRHIEQVMLSKVGSGINLSTTLRVLDVSSQLSSVECVLDILKFHYLVRHRLQNRLIGFIVDMALGSSRCDIFNCFVSADALASNAVPKFRIYIMDMCVQVFVYTKINLHEIQIRNF